MWVWLKKDEGMWLNLDRAKYICQKGPVWQVSFSNKENVLICTSPREFEQAKVKPCASRE